MNIFAWLSLLSCLVSLFMANFVYCQNKKSLLHIIFSLFCLFGAYTAFAEFMQPQAENPDVAFFWIKIDSFWPFILSFLFHFVLIFSEKSRWLRDKLVYLLIYFPALVL